MYLTLTCILYAYRYDPKVHLGEACYRYLQWYLCWILPLITATKIARHARGTERLQKSKTVKNRTRILWAMLRRLLEIGVAVVVLAVLSPCGWTTTSSSIQCRPNVVGVRAWLATRSTTIRRSRHHCDSAPCSRRKGTSVTTTMASPMQSSAVSPQNDNDPLTEQASATLLSTTATSCRRDFVHHTASFIRATTVISLLVGTTRPSHAVSNNKDLNETLQLIQQARTQLQDVPALIQQEKWDAVRTILITPPLADCWARTNRPLLKLYAQALGETANGDELAALEAREEANTHLRLLDTNVYNNVFNPIQTEGESGATKLLIKSYYEDPMSEYKASLAALDELIQLGSITAE